MPEYSCVCYYFESNVIKKFMEITEDLESKRYCRIVQIYFYREFPQSRKINTGEIATFS